MTAPSFPRRSSAHVQTKKGATGGLAPSELGPLVAPWIPPKQQAGGGGGGATTRQLLVTWGGLVPPTDGQGMIFEIPYKPDGTSWSFVAKRAVARMEATYTSDQVFLLQKATGGDVAFAAPTTITTVTIVAGHYRGEQTGLSFTLVSGDLVGLFFSAAGSLSPFMLELIGST